MIKLRNFNKFLKVPNNLNKITILILILFSSTILSLFLWEHINIPVDKSLEYGGDYYDKSYNKNNDTLRFIVFITLSILPFLVSYIFLFKENNTKINQFLFSNSDNELSKDKVSNFIIFSIFIFCILEFFIIDLTFFISDLDLFHEGLWLTPSFNFSLTQKFWAENYIGRGLFGNFYPVLIWNLINEMTIGSVRFFNIFLLLLNKLLLIFLAKQISDNINFSLIKKTIFFISLSLLLASLVDYYNKEEFVKRSPLIILFLNFLLFSLKDYDKYSINFFCLGIFSIISFLWFIDVAAYLNFTLIFIIVFYLIKMQFKISLSILSGITFGWVLFLVTFPDNEISAFFSNTLNIYKSIDQIHGIVFPEPFSGNTRALRTLLLFVIGGVFSIFICLNQNKFNKRNKYFFLFLFILALVSFKTGLSRSDNGHIRTATGPLMIILYTFVVYWIIDFVNFDKYKYFSSKSIIFKLIFFTLIFANFKTYNINKLLNFNDNLNSLIYAEDKIYFRNEKSQYLGLINHYKKISKKDNCIQIITEETALPYLLKKKNCTNYFSPWYVSPKNIQKDFIKQLMKSKPPIILFSSREIRFMPKFKQVVLYIEENYELHSKYKSWTFLKIKKK